MVILLYVHADTQRQDINRQHISCYTKMPIKCAYTNRSIHSPPLEASGCSVSVAMTPFSSGCHLCVPEVLAVLFLTVTHCRQGRFQRKTEPVLTLIHHLFNSCPFRQVSESLPESVSSPAKYLSFQVPPELNDSVYVKFCHVLNKWQLLQLTVLCWNKKDLTFQMKKLRGERAVFKVY